MHKFKPSSCIYPSDGFPSGPYLQLQFWRFPAIVWSSTKKQQDDVMRRASLAESFRYLKLETEETLRAEIESTQNTCFEKSINAYVGILFLLETHCPPSHWSLPIWLPISQRHPVWAAPWSLEDDGATSLCPGWAQFSQNTGGSKSPKGLRCFCLKQHKEIFQAPTSHLQTWPVSWVKIKDSLAQGNKSHHPRRPVLFLLSIHRVKSKARTKLPCGLASLVAKETTYIARTKDAYVSAMSHCHTLSP